MTRLRNLFTYANVMATIAVFLALGGVSYAAFHLPKNSVGSRQIKREAVNGAKVKPGSIPVTALKQIPEGPPGPAGSALAYAHVNADGTLDAANSKNIAATKLTAGTGYYCVSASVPVKNVIATPADTIVGRQIVAGFKDPFTSCPDDAAVIQTFDKAGTASAGAFYLAFN